METPHDPHRNEETPAAAERMNSISPATAPACLTDSRARLLAQRLPLDFAIITAFNLAIALLLTYLMRVGTSFVENLVFSLCIGTLVWLIADAGRIWLWGTCKPPKLAFFWLLAAANTTGWFLGVILASRLLGISAGNLALTRLKSPAGFLLFFTLTCASITWFFWNRARLQQLAAQAEAEKARAAAIEKQAVQAQLQLLQAQIEPHMLFNTLANLQGLIGVDPARAQHMLDQLIQYLRATLSSSRAEQTTLAHEFALMEAYLGLMSVRMGRRLSYALHLPAPLRTAMVPPMLLQPLIENAIRHGLEPKVDGGHIDVRAEAADGILKLTVADTGLGFGPGFELGAAPGDRSGGGIGVGNIRERLQAMYGERATVTLVPNAPAGVRAQLSIPR